MTLTVLHVAQPTGGGVARYVADAVADQARRGWDVHVATGGSGPVVGWLEGARVRRHDWTASRTPGTSVLREVRRLRAVLDESCPDLVHLHSSKAGLVGRLLEVSVPRVVQPHGWSFLAVGGAVRRLAHEWERTAVSRAERVVCVSEAELALAGPAGRSPRFRLVRNGVDVDWFQPDPSASRVRGHLGLGDAPLVACVGRLCRQKGQDRLLRMWPAVTARVPDARLVLVGDGPWQARLSASAPAGVRLAGHRDDVRAWLQAADVVVLPSRWEGLPLTVLEAMACARPVVAFDVGGVSEALGRPGQAAGAVVPGEDEWAFVDAVVSRLHDADRAAAEGEMGRQRAERDFDLRRCTRELAETYLDVVRPRDAFRPGDAVAPRSEVA